MSKIYITPENFIKVWQSSKTLDEVEKTTGMTRTQATVRAGGYRKRGIPLKQFNSPRKRLDVAALTKLAKSIKT